MDLFDLVARLSLDKSEYEQGLDSAEKSGNSFGQRLSGAFGTAAKAGAALGAGAVAAGAAIYGIAQKSAGTADRIDKMSQKLGLSRKAFQELDFIASQSGTSVESMRGGIKALTSQMTKAQSGSKASASAFEKLGLSVTDANGNMKDQETMLWETMEALQGMEDGTEKAALANQLLGRSGAELMPLLNGEAGSIDEMRKQANDLGLVLGDDVIDSGVKLTDTIDQVQRSFSAVATQVGADVMPIIQKALDFVLEHMPEIQSVVSTVFGVLSGFVTTFMNLVQTYVMPILENLISFIQNVFAGNWSAAWGNIKDIFHNVWTGITDFFSTTFSAAAETIKGINWAEVGTAIWDFISGAFTDIATWATDTFTTIKTKVGEIEWDTVGSDIYDTITGAFAEIGTWATTTFETVTTKIGEIDWETVSNTVYTTITGIWEQIIEWATTTFQAAADGISGIDWENVGNLIWEAIKTAFSAVVTWFYGKFRAIKTSITENINWKALGESMLNFIKSAFDAAVTTFKTIFTNVKDEIGKIDWAKVGSDIWNAIQTAFSAVGQWFKNKFEFAVARIMDVDWKQVGEDIWGLVQKAFNAVGSWLNSKFEFAAGRILAVNWKQVGTDIWNAIKSAFISIGTWFYNKFLDVLALIKAIDWKQIATAMIEGIGKGIKGLGSWLIEQFKNIHIPIPKFSVGQGPKVGPIHLPSVSVKWEKKAYDLARMFTSPTVLGTPNGYYGFGDGVGGEIVMSDKKLRDIAGTQETTAAVLMLTEAVENLSDSLTDKMAKALTQMGFNIDGREFARLVRAVGTN